MRVVIGLSSTGATLATCLRYSINKHPQLSSGLNFEWLVQAAKHVVKFDTDDTVELSAAQLPPKSLAAMCIAGKKSFPLCVLARPTHIL